MSKRRSLFLGIIILVIIFLPGYSKFQELRAKNRSLLTQIEELKRENADLARQSERLEKDPFYIEKKAREKMRIGREGEIIYKVVEE